MERTIAWKKRSDVLGTPNWEGTPHLIVLGACFFILAGSLILTPAQSHGDPIHLGPLALPGVCTFNNLTGLPCPGCGLVRSMVAAGHGRLEASVACHRLGLITFAYVLLQFLYRGLWLALPRLRTPLLRGESLLNRGLIVLGGLYVLNWGITLYLIFSQSL